MNSTNVIHEEGHGDRLQRSLRVFAGGGSMVEAIGGVAAIVLAIIGLAGKMQGDVMAIAAIVLGASFILEGGAIAASFRRAFSSLEGEVSGSSQVGGAATVEFLAGFTGMVLGILALLGVGTLNHLVAISAIVFGGALLISSSAVSQLNSFWSSSAYNLESAHSLAQASADAGAGGQMLVGLTAVVLGILALLGINPVVLNLVALLTLGVSALLSGTTFGARNMLKTNRALS